MDNRLQYQFGNIDIYLFDQLLKGTYAGCHKVLDVGCGGGRNVFYLLQNEFEVHGIDPNPEAIDAVRGLAAQLAPQAPADRFKVAYAEDLPYPDASFDLVISSAVLHFAKGHDHFDAMLRSVWRVLKPGGFFFARLASSMGIEPLIEHLGHGRYLLPDGSERYLVDQDMLLQYTLELGAFLHEPIKTTNVQNLRCMTTWCMQKL